MIAFSETQRFRQVWLWILFPVTLAFSAFSIIISIKNANAWDLLPGLGVPILVVILFIFLKLHTRIDEDGVYYKFSFFHFREHHIPWSDIQKAYVRKYSPLSEYGGWGIRFAGKKHGKAYNVSGDMGLQLELTNGKKILIGTQKSKEIEEVLKNLQLKSSIT